MKLLAIILLLSISVASGITNKIKRDILLGKSKPTLVDFLLEAETIIEIQEKENTALKSAFSNQTGEYEAFKKGADLNIKIVKLEARERRVKQSGVVAAVSAILTLTAVVLLRGATTGWKFDITTSSLSPGRLIRF